MPPSVHYRPLPPIDPSRSYPRRKICQHKHASLVQMSVKHIHIFIKQRWGNDHTYTHIHICILQETVGNPQMTLYLSFGNHASCVCVRARVFRWRNSNPLGAREKQMKEKPNTSAPILHISHRRRFLKSTYTHIVLRYIRICKFIRIFRGKYFSLILYFIIFFNSSLWVVLFLFSSFWHRTVIPLGRPVFRWIKKIYIFIYSIKEYGHFWSVNII